MNDEKRTNRIAYQSINNVPGKWKRTTKNRVLKFGMADEMSCFRRLNA